MTGESYNRLQNAHRGYEYQDLVVAIAILKCITNNWDFIRVDKKSFDGDAFDDLVISENGEISKFQIKHSNTKVMSLKNLANSNTKYLLEDIVVSMSIDSESSQSEYHLTTNWTFEGELEGLTKFGSNLPMLDLPCHSFKVDLKSISDNNIVKNIGKLETKLDKLGLNKSIDVRSLILHSDLPQFTSDLTNPGELEDILIRVVIDSIGIGKYPYKNRNLLDFAALVIKLATSCRTNQREIFKNEIEHKLQLKGDFGSLPNNIDIDESIVQNRKALQNEIVSKLGESKIHVLLGAPGTGKSWILSLLSEELSSNEGIVGKHHCYITPIDEDPRLATAEVAIANLVSNFLIKDDELSGSINSKYAVDYIELQKVIDAAAVKYRKVVLIIDGLDHIPRLLKRYPDIAPIDTLVIDSMSKLNLPDNAVILFGTQPGSEFENILERFEDFEPIVHGIHGWSSSEISQLAIDHGIKPNGWLQPTYVDNFIDIIVQKSEGNPLYATYIIKLILASVSVGKVASVEQKLEELPLYGDDINNYYSHIISSSGEYGVAIVKLLAAIPFGVSSVEISEILGGGVTNKKLINASLNSISPLLTHNSDFSGNRIFHESFRRYVLEAYDTSGVTKDVFDEVAKWLESLKYYQDPRAYSFLIKVLINSNTPEKILDIVDPLFLEKSFVAGFNFKQIQENLKGSINYACNEQKWSFLIRVIELNRALYNAEFNEIETLFDFWSFGAHSLNESTANQKIIYEGTPYLSKYDGLKFCKIYHESGLIAPWDIYLELEEDDSATADNSDDDYNQELSNLVIYGNCCIGNAQVYYDKTVKFMNEVIPKFNSQKFYDYLKDIISTFYEANEDPSYFLGIYELIKSIYISADQILRNDVEELLFYFAKLDHNLWSDLVLTQILKDIELGEDLNKALFATSFNARVNVREGVAELAHNWETSDRHEPDELENWLFSLDILVSNSDAIELKRIASTIPADCWFNIWKLFCVRIRLSLIEKEKSEQIKIYLDAYSLLANDVNPSTGEIRSCDLYPFRDIICREVVMPLRNPPNKKTCLKSLIHVCGAVTNQMTFISNSPFSPIGPESIVRELLNFDVNQKTKVSIAYFARWIKVLADNIGSYPEYYRDWYAASAALYKRVGLVSSAKRVWLLNSRYVFGYGFRKDITYYELLRSIEAIDFIDKQQQQKDILDLQGLCERVVKHTDGRSTSNAPVEWLDAVCRIDINSAAKCLSNTFQEIEPYGWYHDQASINLASIYSEASPQIRAAVLMSIPYGDERELETIQFPHLLAEVSSVKEIKLINSEKAEGFSSFLVSKIQGCSGKNIDNQLNAVKKEFNQSGIPFPETWKNDYEVDRFKNSFHTGKEIELAKVYKNLDSLRKLLLNKSEPKQIIKLVNDIDSLKYDSKVNITKITNILGFAFIEVLENFGEDVAIDLLQYLKKKRFFSISFDENIFEGLADGFKRYGYKELAVISYLISMGKSIDLLSGINRKLLLKSFKNAYQINPNLSIKNLCELIKENFQECSYGYGWTSSIINILHEIGLGEEAYSSWKSSKTIIDRRLPEGSAPKYFSRFDFVDASISADTLMAQIFLGHFKNPLLLRRYSSYKLLSMLGDQEMEFVDLGLVNFLSSSCSYFNTRIILCLILKYEKLGLNLDLINLLKFYASCGYGVISLLSKQIGSGNKELLFGAKTYYKPPRSVQSYWITEGYISGAYPAIQKEYMMQLESYKELCKHKEYSNQRYKLSGLRQDTTEELTPVVLWHLEIFEVALDKALDAVINDAWNTGSFQTEKNEVITNDIYLLTCFDVSIGELLSPRPDLELPSDCENKILGVHPLENGWVRASCIEVEKHIARNKRENNTQSFLSIESLIPEKNSGDIDVLQRYLPVNTPLFWLKDILMNQEYVIGSPVFNVLKLGNSYLDIDVTVLSASVIRVLKLNQEKPFDLKWYDSNANLVAYVNIWFERDPQSYDDDRPGIIGSELLINQWLFEEINKIYGSSPKTVKEIISN